MAALEQIDEARFPTSTATKRTDSEFSRTSVSTPNPMMSTSTLTLLHEIANALGYVGLGKNFLETQTGLLRQDASLQHSLEFIVGTQSG
jgi:hypothetical protein